MSELNDFLEKARNVNYNSGDIIFADSNGGGGDCFGVVVDKDFWLEQVKKENVLGDSLNDFYFKQPESSVCFRVLGTKLFRQYWKTNDENELEPHDKVAMNYRFNLKVYTSKIDLMPAINIKNTKTKGLTDSNRFFNFQDEYFNDVLHEAEIVYDYLNGKRFNSSDARYVDRKRKFLRLLETAIPLEK